MDNKQWKNKIYYSQCWEDPYVLCDGLRIQKDDSVLSVTSAGCNTLALLLEDPKEITVIDINTAQTYLFELKITAIKQFSYEELLQFLGVDECNDRGSLYERLRPYLNKDALKWWDENKKLVDSGLIHIGKLETFFRFFSSYILPLIHSKKTIHALFEEKSEEAQQLFYEKSWNTWRWRFFFALFFSKKLLSTKGRNKKLFTYVEDNKMTQTYFDKVKYALSNNPSQNFFLHYMFLGNYSKKALPPYLRKENISVIKERLDKIRIVTGDVIAHIETNPQKYTKFNLSNIFETLSLEQSDAAFESITKSAASRARLVYINHLVERTVSEKLQGMIGHDPEEVLFNKKNMAFFYKKVHIDYLT
jgi:S-adenosylmethionine-diacylglycerol 3-amino-3-carboxypropyl transferase